MTTAKTSEDFYPEPLARLFVSRIRTKETVPEMIEEYGSVSEYLRSSHSLGRISLTANHHLIAQLFSTSSNTVNRSHTYIYNTVMKLSDPESLSAPLANEIKLSLANSLRNDETEGYLNYNPTVIITRLFRAERTLSRFGILYQVLKIPNVLNVLGRYEYGDAMDLYKAISTLYGSLIRQSWHPDRLTTSYDAAAVHNLINEALLTGGSIDDNQTLHRKASAALVSIDNAVEKIQQIDDNPLFVFDGGTVEEFIYWENGFPHLPY